MNMANDRLTVYLQTMTETDLTLHDAIQVIVGTQLSSLTFVMDYWQLAFDGHVFSIMTWLAVDADDRTTRSGEDGFRDRLCAQITKIVSAADFADEVLTITFEDDSTIQAFARDEDYRQPCPEALLFQSYEFKTLYVV
jgi:hypothetical protein